MAVSDRSRSAIGGRTSTATGISRYDLYLLAIPLVFLAATLIGVLAPVALHQSVFGGSLVAVGILLDGLFVNPPKVDGSR